MSQVQLSEREVRIEKIQNMKELGVIPYAQSFDKADMIGDIIKQGEEKDKQGKLREIEDIIKNPEIQVKTAGRVMLYRSHGKLTFARLLDSTEQIQLMFHRDQCYIDMAKSKDEADCHSELDSGFISDGKIDSGSGPELQNITITAYKFMEKMVDVGDFIGIRGELFRTHKGELTIFVKEFKFLSKAIRPLPEKFHGLKDKEDIYRKRYLDMTMNPDSYKRFLFKSKFYQILRKFYSKEGFTEIQTPILDNAASGAAARPFITHHNDYDTDIYLRIAFETSLKKATVGRFEKVFEIGQDFRNEGSDPSHLQEFTQVEHYAVYWNYEDNMKFTEKMMDYIFDEMGLDRKLKVKDKEGVIKEVDFTTPWERIDYTKGIYEASGIDITQYEMEDSDRLRNDIVGKGIEFEGMEIMGTTTLIDYLYKKVLRPKIIGPAFIYNYPVIMQPLARGSDKNTDIVEQFQLLVNGWEICKAYSELVDPLLQQDNFDKQKEAGDEEATAEDKSFVEAMEYGMPPQSGFGMGLERILAILTEQDNLRDVVMFPLMKPLGNQSCKRIETSSKAIDYGKLPTEDELNKLVDKYLNDTKLHCQQVGKVMKYFASKLLEDEETWYTVGLLHDIDWDFVNKNADKHLKEDFDKIMDEIDASEELRSSIKSHGYWLTDIQPENLLDKYLVSADELVGFLYAYSLMRPEGFKGMKVSSIKKKLKDKKFASGVDREQMKNCEEFLGIDFEEFVMDVVEGLK